MDRYYKLPLETVRNWKRRLPTRTLNLLSGKIFRRCQNFEVYTLRTPWKWSRIFFENQQNRWICGCVILTRVNKYFILFKQFFCKSRMMKIWSTFYIIPQSIRTPNLTTWFIARKLHRNWELFPKTLSLSYSIIWKKK